MIGVLEVIRIISEGTMEGRGQTMEGNHRRMSISIVRAARLPTLPTKIAITIAIFRYMVSYHSYHSYPTAIMRHDSTR